METQLEGLSDRSLWFASHGLCIPGAQNGSTVSKVGDLAFDPTRRVQRGV